MNTIPLRHTISGVTHAYSVDYAQSLLADPHYKEILEEVEPEETEGCVDCPSDEEPEATEPAKTKKDEK